MSLARPKIALTMGDPAGIGPELAVKTAASGRFGDAELVIYGAPQVIDEAARRFTPGFHPDIEDTGDLELAAFEPGTVSGACGLAAYRAVERAALDAVAERCDAIVTSPMNKAAVNAAGIPFSGHTEMIAGLCHCDSFAMMQSAGALHVAFVTTHIPLAAVPGAVTTERICEVARLLSSALEAENVKAPKLAAMALNPHAGENGFMGGEDECTVKPALAKLRETGIDIDGPFPPDTLFIPGTQEKYDGILAMYHDQGHIPFKMLAFDRGVNSTLGLPIVRTSPDHGTAFDIAWRGVADVGSIFCAVEVAIRHVKGRK